MYVNRALPGTSTPDRDGPRIPAADLRCTFWLGVLVLLSPMLAAAADGPNVTIEGGARPGNTQYYDWKVTNHHSSPIVYIHFPQYCGDTFTPPKDWSNEWKNRMMLGGRNAPGWVRTSVENPRDGIQPGRSADFEMRIALAGALVRPGKVTVRFADGTETVVGEVELPSAPGFVERNIMSLAMGVIFMIVLVIHFHRRRKTTPPTPMESPSGDGQ